MTLSEEFEAATAQREAKERRREEYVWRVEGGALPIDEALALAAMMRARGAAEVRIGRFQWPEPEGLRYGVRYRMRVGG